MKTTTSFLSLFLLFLLLACDNVDEKAQQRYLLAQKAFEEGNFGKAKTEIDSIKILFPKAFETRKASIKLLQQVELAEQKKSLAFYDSVLVAKQQEFETMKKNFVLEKNAEYQETGDYRVASQLLEKNLNRTYLRGQVTEQGVFSVTSIYNGSKVINHKGVRTSCGETFVETPLSTDAYYTKNLGTVTEKADFAWGNDDGLIDFIVINKNNTIKVELTGGKSKHSYTLRKSDATAIASLYELAQLIQSIEETKRMKAEAERHIAFIQQNAKE